MRWIRKCGKASAENTEPDAEDSPLETLVKNAISDEIKTRVDEISRELMRLRLEQPDQLKTSAVKNSGSLPKTGLCFGNSAGNPLSRDFLRKSRLPWISSCLPSSVHQKAILRDASSQTKLLDNALDFRSLIKSRELMVAISLHLSSHGDGFGAFSKGWLYPLKPSANRSSAYTLPWMTP